MKWIPLIFLIGCAKPGEPRDIHGTYADANQSITFYGEAPHPTIIRFQDGGSCFCHTDFNGGRQGSLEMKGCTFYAEPRSNEECQSWTGSGAYSQNKIFIDGIELTRTGGL